MKDAFFGLSSYHFVLTAIGIVVILAYWLPRFLSNREPAAPGLLMLFGAVAFWFLPDIRARMDPRDFPVPWELVSEMVVIIALFGAGLRIDNLSSWTRWSPTARLLAVAMPLTIVAVALLGVTVAGMTIAGAILLGAVLSPTDPVLAGDVQVGPPLEGGEHPVRFALTTEAGLNDGLAFPFVYLGLIVAAQGFAPAEWGIEWLARDVVYRIGVGTVMGIALGWLLGKVIFRFPSNAVLAESRASVIVIPGIFAVYGLTELVEGYGFISVVVAGTVLRRIERDHEFHRDLHDFSETIEHALTALVLVALGAVLPLLLFSIDWAHVLIVLALIFVIRPLAGWLSLVGTDLTRRERLAVAAYGVRGIGSIYYLGYAAAQIEFVNEGQLWGMVGIAILLSTMLHGFTAGYVIEQVEVERQEAPATA